jgi:NADH:ubiquinone reductase (non-electrogenic)
MCDRLLRVHETRPNVSLCVPNVLLCVPNLLVCDRWLRVHGCPGIIALGDCSCIQDLPLPATAQVAAQQGAYLARLFNREYDLEAVIPSKRPSAPPETLAAVRVYNGGSGSAQTIAKPFEFLNLGILAYTGARNPT